MWKSDHERETGRYGVAVSLSTCSALTLPLLQHFALAPRAFSDFLYFSATCFYILLQWADIFRLF